MTRAATARRLARPLFALLLALGLLAPVALAELRVHVIDVGQGDAILLEAPGARVLVDAGGGPAAAEYLRARGVTTLELVVATHAHADHVGGFPAVFEAVTVLEAWYNGQPHPTLTFERFLDALLESDARYHEPARGEVREFGRLRLEVLHPTGSAADSDAPLHDANIVLRVVYGDVAFLLTGDAEAPVERELLAAGVPLRADVLKLGHHGSRTSSTPEFVRAVAPAWAVYSAGEDNRYGHPHDDALAAAAAAGATVVGTDRYGTILFTTDGRALEAAAERPAADAATLEPPRSAPAAAGCVDLNEADRLELTRIVHIDEVRARQIEERRPFADVREIVRVRGIADARLRDILEQGVACVRAP